MKINTYSRVTIEGAKDSDERHRALCLSSVIVFDSDLHEFRIHRYTSYSVFPIVACLYHMNFALLHFKWTPIFFSEFYAGKVGR